VKPWAAALVLLAAGCAPHGGGGGIEAAPAALRGEIWAQTLRGAGARGLDPLFVYAVVKIESDFNPRAQRGENRGLMQIKPELWRSATAVPYEGAVWDWKANLAVGMEVMRAEKVRLEARGVFSYPLLWASYRYGSDYVARHGYDLSRMPRPEDPLGRRLWSGDLHPVIPPK
jgi:hypothetical protein